MEQTLFWSTTFWDPPEQLALREVLGAMDRAERLEDWDQVLLVASRCCFLKHNFLKRGTLCFGLFVA
jgi:hypothetical protein